MSRCISLAAIRPGRPGGWRACRVVTLLACVVVLSVLDLLVTHIHLRTTGMIEANPIAAWIIESSGSLFLLSLYKLGTAMICVSLLYCLRERVQGEIGAWCAVLIMGALAVLWTSYASHVASADDLAMFRDAYADQWLYLE